MILEKTIFLIRYDMIDMQLQATYFYDRKKQFINQASYRFIIVKQITFLIGFKFVNEYIVFFLTIVSVKIPQRPGCTTLKPFVLEHLYRKISLDQVRGYVNKFQKSKKIRCKQILYQKTRNKDDNDTEKYNT
jgi:hypothetical protein